MVASVGACKIGRSTSSGRGFFSLFYEWSTACASYHTPNGNPIRKSPCRSLLQIRQNSTLSKDGATAPSSKQTSTEPLLSSHLRTVMRSMPHSVVVATSTSPSASPSREMPPKYRGMTVSSFTTLTLTPSPIVTLNIRKPSSTLDAMRESGKFHIHVLSATRSGAKVADAFTKGNGQGSEGELWRNDAFTVFQRAGEVDSPPLLGASGVVRVLRCEVLKRQQGFVEVGDHTLVLGQVVGILVPPGSGEEEAKAGLCYSDAQYRAVGDVIDTNGAERKS